MLVKELLGSPVREVLLEGRQLEVYEALLPLLLITEENGDFGGGDGGDTSLPDGTTPTEVLAPPPAEPAGTWFPRAGVIGVFRPGGTGMNANRWINELYRTLKNLAVASNIKKRLKQLGVGGEGAKRVDQAIKTAAKQAKYLLSTPGILSTAYRIPVWTTGALPAPVIKKWNESFEQALKAELAKIDLYD